MAVADERPVFYDPGGRRWRRVRRTWLLLAVLVTSFAVVLVASVLINPLLPRLDLRSVAALPHPADIRIQSPPLITTRREQNAQRAESELRRSLQTTKVVPGKRPAQMSVIPPPLGMPPPVVPTPGSKPLSIGFFVNWDDSSYASLKRNLAQLDWVVPEWIRLQDGDDPLVREIDPPALNLIRQERPTTAILPLIQNYKNELWNSDLIANAVADEAARTRLVQALLDLVERNKFNGVCIDFEEVPANSQGNLYKFMEELHAAFQARNLLVTQAVPFDDSDWDYKKYAATTDYLMLMAYDQHWSSSKPGPVAAQDWYEQTLARRMRELDPAKTIICIGGYGYDWSDAEAEATEVTFQEALLSAADSTDADSTATIKYDAARNPYFTYDEEDGSSHSVWFLDAVTAYNQMRAASGYRPAGYALWRLGSEDPSLWSIFGNTTQLGASFDSLRQIRYGYDIDFEGTGEILQVKAEPKDGARTIKYDAETGYITGENYTAIPSSYVIKRAGDHPGLVALTFDDGPDPKWTPKILDILKEKGVPAAFFIIGENGQASPQLVKRIVAEGHDIGNHTFTHPNLGEIPGRITDLELNATQRLIESLTRRSTALFRPPYFGDAEPTTPDQVDPIVRAKQLGYLTVGLHVDPDDWALPGTDEIVQRTIDGITDKSLEPEQRGQVVLLHDGGGDRSETVEALPRIIDELKARGYRFVTISELAGLSQEQTMRPLQQQGLAARSNAITFYALALGGWLLNWIFLIGIALGLARLIIIGALAFAQWLRSRKRESTHAGSDYNPLVTIIVPAYNEERVINKTLESLLASTYTNFEIIVVDDGSSDGTSNVVRERYADERRVRLYHKESGGKAAALNHALALTRGEVIIALDADTVFPAQTIGALAHRFYDARIGAVAGNAKVGNRLNLVTRWQALEYITAQNLDRRAFASLNCITVVPGAVGAWRRDLLERAGGFSADTLAEDQDLTLRVRRLGYLVGYEEDAIAWTEAPDTLGGLAKQRFRWSFGTLQCMWKHKGALLRLRYGTLGWVAMPNVWIFQILFPLISPVMDLMLVWSFIATALERLEHPNEHVSSNFEQVLFYYALFLAVDWVAAAFAFMLERREQWSLLWWLFLQRFGYRQIMYYVMVKSVAMAARGAIVGWGKIERKATVATQQ